MTALKKYDLEGKDKGEVSIEETLLEITANPQMIKDYLVAKRANARQWSASTQTRAEVSCTKRKPFKQKGTGNARQGFLGAAQFRGGGRVHAPKPKFNQHIGINRREKRQVIRYLLGSKIKENHAHVLEYKTLKNPETKTLAKFLEALNLTGKRVLFLAEINESGSKQYQTLSKSVRNIPKVEFTYIPNVGGEDLALCQEVIILESALPDFKETLGGQK